jgi:outer membrane lipoprotein carrier protein
MLRGVPQNMTGQVNQVILEITPESWIRRILIEAVDGSVTDFRFNNQRANVDLPDSQFRFSPPPGIAVVDGDLAP